MGESGSDGNTEQSVIDPHREMNRYPDREAELLSSTVYEPPRRTLGEGWQKFHAARNCGSRNVYYIEEINTRCYHGDKRRFRLRCGSCGYRIPEDEILFIGGEWYSQYGWQNYGRPIEDLRLPADRVVELGPDPSHNELIDALELTRIERESGPPIGGGIQRNQWEECDECGHEVPLRYDDRCRMCYDGEWTERMCEGLTAFEGDVREWHNDSHVHKLESKVDPLSINGKASVGTVLWRKASSEELPKIAVVSQRLTDSRDDHREYILTAPGDSDEYRLRESELDAKYYDTEKRSGGGHQSISKERMKQLQDD